MEVTVTAQSSDSDTYCVSESPPRSHPVLCHLFNPASLSQTLTEPAIFASETSCDCRAPHEKLTIAQARRGTPGTTDLHLLRGFSL